ncbi:MAG TPA: hypothetical protein VHZ24_12580 [Pirellulales bacterium]|nr:hypothetical protein [Pirellulales bacterium]
MKEIFKDDLSAAKTSEAKQTLATKLIQRGQATQGDPAERYAMLATARQSAIDAGAPSLATTAIAALSDLFEIDVRGELAAALGKMADKATLSPTTYKDVAESASAEADAAAGDEDWDAAKRLSDISLAAMRKSKDPVLVRQMVERSKSVAADRQQWDAAEAARAALKENPNDAAANLVVGRYLCFVRDDWDEGLKHLAASNGPAFKELAEKSREAANEPAAQPELGDAWWDAAEKAKLKEKAELRAGAAPNSSLVIDVGGKPNAPSQRFRGAVRSIWLGNDQPGPAPKPIVSTVGAHPPQATLPPANGLGLPQTLDCSAQTYSFDVGPGFNVSGSGKLQLDFLSPSAEKKDRVLWWFGDPQLDSPTIYVKYRGDSLEARIGDGTAAKESMVLRCPLMPAHAQQWGPVTFAYDGDSNEIALLINGQRIEKKQAVRPKPNRSMRAYIGARPGQAVDFPGMVRAIWPGN